jgi:hypothetical protein
MADDQPTTEQEPVTETASSPPPGDQSPLGVASEDDPFAARPEAFVGAAFAGGLALAFIMRRLAR